MLHFVFVVRSSALGPHTVLQAPVKKVQQAGLKRKAISEETGCLKKLKLNILNDIDAVLKFAERFADKAEKLRDIMFIAKSNSLHCTAKDKEVELKSVTDQLEASRVQLQDLQGSLLILSCQLWY